MVGKTNSGGPLGILFTPNVDIDGNLSWTNNGELENPPARNIKGLKGDPGRSGVDLGAYVTPTATGTIARFDDGAEDLPVKSLMVDIDPAQSGWTGVKVTRSGKNLLCNADDFVQGASYNPSIGTVYSLTPHTYNFGVPYYDGDTLVLPNAPWNFYRYGTPPVPVSVGDQISFNYASGREIATSLVMLNDNYAVIRVVDSLQGADAQRFDFIATALEGEAYAAVILCARALDEPGRYVKPMLVLGNPVDAAEFELPQGDTYDISFPDEAGTVYGGTLDATNGVLTVTNGSTPGTYQLTPIEVKTMLGANNIWADTGDVSVSYRADPTIIYNKLTAAIISSGGAV